MDEADSRDCRHWARLRRADKKAQEAGGGATPEALLAVLGPTACADVQRVNPTYGLGALGWTPRVCVVTAWLPGRHLCFAGGSCRHRWDRPGQWPQGPPPLTGAFLSS